MNKRNRFWRQAFSVLTLVFLALVIWSLFSIGGNPAIEEVTITEISSQIEADNVNKVVVEGNKITAETKDDKKLVS